MQTPEEFRRQLEQRLSTRRQSDLSAAQEKKKQAQILRQTINQNEKKTKIEGKQREKGVNRAAVLLDRQLPIGEYLTVLKNKIAPLEYVRRYGPTNGEIAYVIPYKTDIYEQTHIVTWQGSGPAMGGGGSEEVSDGWKIERHMLITKINSDGWIKLSNESTINDLFDPFTVLAFITLNPFLSSSSQIYIFRSGKLEKNFPSREFNTDPPGLSSFSQTLADFYVGFKTGQIK